MLKRFRNVIVGNPRDIHDASVYHRISLIAFLAWVGLGVDGLSSSCYGPEEAFRVLQHHPYLSLFVGLATVLTIFVISSSYTQIIRLFPSGGGGYLVASKLLSPTIGVVSGSALLIDYVMTITLSVASGTDALFSFLPAAWLSFKLPFAITGVLALTVLNMRGVKESVMTLLPIFLVFVATHLSMILYVLVSHGIEFTAVASKTATELSSSVATLGLLGTFALIFKAYSMGAGTFTGIEAVSNAIPMLRDPKVETATHTMRYMAISLSVLVLGLLVAYAFYEVRPVEGKTLNAVLFQAICSSWGQWGMAIVILLLLSEAFILFIAAQTGFLGGPRVLANMALDKWFPVRFALLSDRLVTQNGLLMMGLVSLIMMLISRGSVHFLVILYSINVFITFTLSQLGMVRHWWSVRHSSEQWRSGITINGIGLVLTSFILISVIVVKFSHGGWLTLAITGGLIALAMSIKHHYVYTENLLSRLDDHVLAAISEMKTADNSGPEKCNTYNPEARTAVVLVNGFTGLGLHTVYNILKIFGDTFHNYAFVQIGVIDAGRFKGIEEVDQLRHYTEDDVQNYVDLMRWHGYYAEGFISIGIDVVEEIEALIPKILKRFPNSTFFGGQLVFPHETLFTRVLHNYTIFTVQRRLYHRGIPMVILPISTEFPVGQKKQALKLH
jgi:amino acid transporter